MATVERSAVIGASTEEVWAVLSDFATISTWAPNVDHSCLMSDQTDGVGATRRIQTDRSTVLETVETWEPGHRLSYRITGLPSVIKSVTNTWCLSPAGDATEVRLTTEIDTGSRPPQQLIAKVIGKRLGAASDLMLEGLARSFESDSGVTS